MLSRFFIDRPIFAWVLAIVVMLAGAFAIYALPLEQYPDIALPQVQIHASYPGASAKTMEDSVTQVIEQQMKGIDNLLYVSSSSDSSGTANVNLTFQAGTNADIAQVQVQNKLQSALPRLPAPVQQQGLSVVKSSSAILMIVALESTDSRATDADIGDFAASNLVDEIGRVHGVGQVELFGAQYAMRIWLDPNKLSSYSLVPADVIGAVQAQNAEVSAGQIGGVPAMPGVALNATITSQSRLQTPDQFNNIVVKSGAGGAVVRLSDVARVTLGAEDYGFAALYNGRPAVGVAVHLTPGGNALSTAEAVKARLTQLAAHFPPDVRYEVAVDSTPFIQKSIGEVVRTLIEAVVLVFLVIFLFLQNWRATLIPTIAVPVVLLGTVGLLKAFGYSLNTLTLFGLVLAIGLLVDDAIVVVENVERLMRDEGLTPVEATRKSMGEITGALVGIALVLAAVFVPMAFFGGSEGIIYRQFSVTLVSAMALSVMVALVLTPALCATLLKPLPEGHGGHGQGFFGWFNRNFDQAERRYVSALSQVMGRGGRMLVIYGLIVAVMAVLFLRLPAAFLPEEDQGVLFTIVQLPPGATMERTQAVVRRVAQHYIHDEARDVKAIFTIVGFSFSGSGQNNGQAFVRLKSFDTRGSAAKDTAQALARRAMATFGGYRDAMVFALTPPPVPALGNASGFDLELEDVGGLGHEALSVARDQLIGMAHGDAVLAGVRANGQGDTPQFRVDIDQAKVGAMGLSMADINTTLSTALGGAYIDDFIDRGRVKRVFVQADAPFRMRPDDLDAWRVRNGAGAMVPFSAFATSHWTLGPPELERFNGVPAMEIQGSPAPGRSTGQAMAEIERLASRLPSGVAVQWTGLSLQERESGAQAPMLYGLSVLVVFLVLSALYESWTIPLAVILVIPLGITGALLATTLRGLSNDIYFQVGLLTTMGLGAKNAILIVEFAKEAHRGGLSLVEATLYAARTRLRPILMTSLAFVFGVMPLAISSGAGSGSQHAIGTGVIGGMLAVTVMGIFYSPIFFVLVQRHLGRAERTKAAAAPAVEGEL